MKRTYHRREFLKTAVRVSLCTLLMPRMVAKQFLQHPFLPTPPLPALDSLETAPTTFIQPVKAAPKIIIPKGKLTFYNIHTGEWLKKCDIPTDGAFPLELEQKIKQVFIDHRANKTHVIDKRLIRLLMRMMHKIDTNKPIHLVSGYRSCETNTLLHQTSRGVAKKSYHTRGMAADIFLEGVSNQRLQKIAMLQKAGGVGRYTRFVHVDTGRVRRWGLLLGC